MAALPALTRNYFSRNNIPFGSNNTSRAVLQSYWAWGLYACLTNQITSGSTGGTRHANSVWFVRGSSNTTGSAISGSGIAGPDRWGATFPGAFTGGNNSTAHHWMMLENSNLGYELLINIPQDFSSGYITISMAPTGTFSGGTGLSAPQAAVTSAPVQLNQTAYSATDNGEYTLYQDYTNTGNTNYLHFTTADSGEFWFGASRAGLGVIHNWISLWKSTGQQASDNRNIFLLCSSQFTNKGGLGPTAGGGGGAPRMSDAGFCASRQPNGSQKSAGGFNSWGFITSFGADALSAKFNSVPAIIIETTPQTVYRGTLQDYYLIGDATIGASIPNSSAQERVVVGNMILPCTGSALLL